MSARVSLTCDKRRQVDRRRGQYDREAEHSLPLARRPPAALELFHRLLLDVLAPTNGTLEVALRLFANS